MFHFVIRHVWNKVAHASKAPDVFILDAITQPVERSEADAAFHQIADDRWANFLGSGRTIAWEDAKTWLVARFLGQRPARSVPHPPNT